MPTLDDLQAAFAELERQAPAATTAPAGAAAHRRARRPAVLAAAACIAVIAGLGVAASHRVNEAATPASSLSAAQTTAQQHDDPPFPAALPAPADGQSPVLSYGFVDSGVGSAQVTPDQVTRTYQHATVTTTTTAPGELFVFYGGAYDPSAAKQGDPTTIGGRAGYFAHVAVPGNGDQDALVWQYADNGWALVYALPTGGLSGSRGTSSGSTAADRRAAEQRQAQRQAQLAYVRELETQLAEHLHASALALPLTSPVRVPAGSGLYVQSVSDGPDGAIDLDTGAASDNELGTAFSLGWSPSPLGVDDKPDTGVTTINGRTWAVFHDRVSGAVTGLGLVLNTDWGLTVTPADGVSTAALEQFAASLQIASDPSNSATWFDASEALP